MASETKNTDWDGLYIKDTDDCPYIHFILNGKINLYFTVYLYFYYSKYITDGWETETSIR